VIASGKTDFGVASAVLQNALASGVLTPSCRSRGFHDLDALGRRVSALKRSFRERTLHAIAVKANPVVSILRELVALGMGLETASMEEVHVALKAGCEPGHIVFDSPVKTADEIEDALRLGLYLNIDNFAELDRIARSPRLAGSEARFGIRVNHSVRRRGPTWPGGANGKPIEGGMGTVLGDRQIDLVRVWLS
jgi:diaminopimelate decarboxylase